MSSVQRVQQALSFILALVALQQASKRRARNLQEKLKAKKNENDRENDQQQDQLTSTCRPTPTPTPMPTPTPTVFEPSERNDDDEISSDATNCNGKSPRALNNLAHVQSSEFDGHGGVQGASQTQTQTHKNHNDDDVSGQSICTFDKDNDKDNDGDDAASCSVKSPKSSSVSVATTTRESATECENRDDASSSSKQQQQRSLPVNSSLRIWTGKCTVHAYVQNETQLIMKTETALHHDSDHLQLVVSYCSFH